MFLKYAHTVVGEHLVLRMKGGPKMRFRIWCLPVVPALLFGTAISVQAQWMPVIAKQKEITYRIEENGSKVAIAERRGTFKRSSAGSTMRTWIGIVDGKAMGPGMAMLLDARSGSYYAINHRVRQARLMRQRSGPILPRERNLQPEDIVGHSVVNGVPCVGLKVKVNGRLTDGVDWVSVSHDLHVKTEFPLPGGKRVVKELYDIQFVEPTPSAFAIPKNYKLSRQ